LKLLKLLYPLFYKLIFSFLFILFLALPHHLLSFMSSLSTSPSKMGCTASVSHMMVSRHSPDSPPVVPTAPAEKTFGKITLINGDGSKIASGVLVPVGQITRFYGRITANPVIKIKSDQDNATYEQVDWIAKYKDKFVARSVYESDPAAAEAYARAVFKLQHTPRPPRTGQRVMQSPMRRMVFGVPQPPIQSLNLPPFPPKLI
jgi:hypothetical protein